jgi:hypothetical protein
MMRGSSGRHETLMARVTVSALANADSIELLSHLERHAGRIVAVEHNQLFERLFDWLADHPNSGGSSSR